MGFEYLLFLQNLREGLNGVLDSAISFITSTAVGFIPLMVLAFVYWNISKKWGMIAMRATTFGDVINQFVKLTACIYRPWILDSRIKPVESALRSANDYSFPSGHTSKAMTNYGTYGIGLLKKHKLFGIILILYVVLIGVSRNFLGVHTFKDVFVGFVIALVCVLLSIKVEDMLQNNKLKEEAHLLICLVIPALATVYTIVKPYPMDYVDGKLLVDPKAMTMSAYSIYAALAVFGICHYIDHKWIKYEVNRSALNTVLSLILTLPIFGLTIVCYRMLIRSLGYITVSIIHDCVAVVYIMLIVPFILKALNKKKKNV